MARRKRDKYLNNKNMYAQVLKSQDQGYISDDLGKMFLLLAKRYSDKPNFSGYTYKDEMVASGVLACCKSYNKFDGGKSENPFAYFTTCIHHAFLQVLNSERKCQNIRDELMLENDLNPSFGFLERNKSKTSDDLE